MAGIQNALPLATASISMLELCSKVFVSASMLISFNAYETRACGFATRNWYVSLPNLIADTQVSAVFLTSAGLIYFIVNYLTYHNLSFAYVCKLIVVSLRVLLLNWCTPT